MDKVDKFEWGETKQSVFEDALKLAAENDNALIPAQLESIEFF